MSDLNAQQAARRDALTHSAGWQPAIVALVVGVLIGLVGTAGIPHSVSAQSLSAFVVDEGADALLRYDDFSGAPEEIVPDTEAGNPARVALDPVNGYVYWTDVGTSGPNGRILRARRSGAAVETVIDGLGNPVGLALDPADGKLYWTDSQADAIYRSNLDGSGQETLVEPSADVHAPVDIALDVQNGMMYWANGGDQGSSNGSLARANTDGSSVEQILTGRDNPTGIALDVDGGHVYWAERGTEEILRAQLDGSNEEMLVDNAAPLGLALDLEADKLYWTRFVSQSDPGEILRADLAGTNQETLRSDLNRPLGIALNTNPPLPVELVAFEGRVDQSDVVLTWTTASEQQNAGFSVQHFRDGSFVDVGWIEGAGTSASEQRYTHRVKGLAAGMHRFRLEQVDRDGTTTYSPEVEIRVDALRRLTLRAPYPNPASGPVTVDYELSRPGRVELSVHDVLGRRVQTVVARGVAPGLHTARIATDELPSGLYIIRLSSRDAVRITKMSIVR